MCETSGDQTQKDAKYTVGMAMQQIVIYNNLIQSSSMN